MDVPLCPGCRERDAIIEALQTRITHLEAEQARQQQVIQRLDAQLQRLTERLAQYEPEVRSEGRGGGPADAGRPAASYSLDAEQQRRQRRKRRRKPSPGRRPTELKFADAQRHENVYPPGVRHADCRWARGRAVWRLENGKAVLVGYSLFVGPLGQEPRIPGVTPRCEYGIEILVVLAFLVYIIGISLDKACAVLRFFCQLPLSKSQADGLLRQLAKHWEGEWEILCDLIAHAAIVHLDETGWKVGREGCSLWVFASTLQRVFLFGCHKDEATLDQMLPVDVFTGIGISDDAAVYRERFRQAQKCWAHLLRKAIRLALWYPRKKRYQRFLDQLLALYREAQRAAEDGRLGEAGRQARVSELEGRLSALLQAYACAATAARKPHERDFANLVEELSRLLVAEELFTFVLVPGVEPTNNSLERELRSPAQDRKAGRTSKTAAGAHRRSVLVSVLASLRANLAAFDLASVVEEVSRWMQDGISLFAQQWHATRASTPRVALDTT